MSTSAKISFAHMARRHLLSSLLLLLPLASPLVAAQATTCIEDPSQAACVDYVYPAANATSDTNGNCGMMPYMVQCTVRDLCIAKLASGEDLDADTVRYCDAMSVLADGCEYDMDTMPPCSNYVALCDKGTSVVEQCTEFPSIPGLPLTSETNTAIKSICNSHTMPGCEQCPFETPGNAYMNCSLLLVYSQLCLQMPDMTECAAWKEMCTIGVPTWPELCPYTGADSEQPPVMRMYFHAGFSDYLLFYKWVPRTSGEYWGSIVVNNLK